MEFIKLVLLSPPSKSYSYEDASNVKMCIIGHFLAGDARYDPSSFVEYAHNDWEEETCSNLTVLKKENGYILLTDLYSEEGVPTAVKMTREQFVQILTDWEEKVLKLRPKEVVIRYENDQYVIETKD